MLLYFRLPVLVTLSAFVCGCQYETFNAALVQWSSAKKRLTANRLAAGAGVFQRSILALANSVSSGVSREIENSDVLKKPIKFAGMEKLVSNIDMATGHGAIKYGDGEEGILDLSFGFQTSPIDKGKLIDVSSLEGNIDGYDIYFSRLTFSFLAKFDESGHPEKSEKGDFHYTVLIEAQGVIGLNDLPKIYLNQARFGIDYPLPEAKSKIGNLAIATVDGFGLDAEFVSEGSNLTGAGTFSEPGHEKAGVFSAESDGTYKFSEI